ncbi:hypothetical protein DV737_g4247, partial [Chaetothyriales sp. CBS 132003]
MSAADDSRSASRRVDLKSQKSSAGSRDGTAATPHSRKGGKSTLSLGRQSDAVHTRPTAPPQQPQPQAQPAHEHGHLNGFDSAEVVAVLRAGVDLKAPLYRPDGRTAAPKGSPWGTKPTENAEAADQNDLRDDGSFVEIPDHSVTDFQAKVYAHLLAIPEGKVTSYAALARALNSSPRAVGGALRSNPWAPDVPCHRVIASDGFVGGFKGDWQDAPSGVNQSRKLDLLKHEGVHFTSDGKLITARASVWFDGPWDTTQTSKEIARRKLRSGL